ncbi:GlsB/YeaQ/YmgE family stress response membrane protein [Streptomyces massasporeus]|uniref:GlsB/YeaQ/YmgE family stress response membrane protein n=1 Tax=Streptomyces TaxID=1883 RepID=UPI001618310E|nr:GlsB/YeaQ/YmgE family stress response membrane protein [Streptomyces sp. AK010]MBB6416689.1 putative membrane protein YeaQ/YmgE (transglycosylase-associated protein family) [Streptomyces sp. AK010]
MGWLWAIIVGLVLGLLAKAIIPGKQHLPLWLTVILGMIGGIAGNAIARAAGVDATSGIDWWRHIFQLVMAIILVGLGDRAWTATRGDKGKAKA